jgi:hypothetical protein
MALEQDFPAGHSMDSDWFAVDAQGHVAVFDTDEPGPVPEEAYGDQGARWSIVKELSTVPYDISDLAPTADGKIILAMNGHEMEKLPPGMTSGLFWFASEAVAQPFLTERNQRLTGSAGECLIQGDIPAERIESARAQGQLHRAWINHELSLERFGFFTYKFSYPYERQSAPQKPVLASQLPPPVAQKMGQLVIEQVDFSRDHAIEPRLFTQCVAYGDDDAGGGPEWLANKTWLGADALGRIAVFHTGDYVAPVPFHVDFREDLLAHLINLLTGSGTYPYDIADLLVQPDGEIRDGRSPKTIELTHLPDWLPECLIWVTSEEALSELKKATPGLRQMDVPGAWMGIGMVPKKTFISLREAQCIKKAWTNYRLEAWRFGLIEYRPAEGEENPYRQTKVGRNYLYIDALPAAIRPLIERFTFAEVDFARDEVFDPRKYMECISGIDDI